MSLRAVSAALAEQGHLNERGKPVQYEVCRRHVGRTSAFVAVRSRGG